MRHELSAARRRHPAAARKTPAYDRAALVDVLVHHARRDISSCRCGWAEIGRSHPEHVADVYEQAVAALGGG